MTLNSKFLEDLKIEDMIEMKTTVKLDDKESTTSDYVRLITKEEVESLSKEILKCTGDYGYWTMSPSYFGVTFNAREFYVTSTGELLGWLFVVNGYGVRPVVTLKSEALNINEFDESNSCA